MAQDCPQCGESNGDAALMCGMCGTVLKRAESSPTLQQPTPTASVRPKIIPRGGPSPSTTPHSADKAPPPQLAPPIPRPRRDDVIEGVEPAGFWIRLAATLIDGLILLPVVAVFGVIWNAAAGGDENIQRIGTTATSLLSGLAYPALLESSSLQATLGKRILGLVVTDTDNERIGIIRAVARIVLKNLQIGILFGLLFLRVAFDEDKQGFHDLLCGTYVQRKVRI